MAIVHMQKRSGRDGPDTRHGLKEPVLAHHPMRRERLEVCNNAAGSSAPAQRCAGSRARMSDQKAASAGAQHVCHFATRLLLRVALLLSVSCTGRVQDEPAGCTGARRPLEIAPAAILRLAMPSSREKVYP